MGMDAAIASLIPPFHKLGASANPNAIFRSENYRARHATPQQRTLQKRGLRHKACLAKNNFLSHKCIKVIQLLQTCCEDCNYQSTHCASASSLLKQISK